MHKKNMIRIIGGNMKGKYINVLNDKCLRPTLNIIRETMFNWLDRYIKNANILDLFSGSGAFGFESYSRGANNIIMVENNYKIYVNLVKNKINIFNNVKNIVIVYDNALFVLQEQILYKNIDIIFLDPPYNSNYLYACFKILDSFVLKNQTKIIFELNYKIKNINLPYNWIILKFKQTSNVYYYMIEYHDKK